MVFQPFMDRRADYNLYLAMGRADLIEEHPIGISESRRGRITDRELTATDGARREVTGY